MNQSDTIDKLSPALVAALALMEGVKKDSKNPHFKNDYASLEAVTEAARPILAANGLCVIQGVGGFDGRTVTISTRLLHTSGQWIESEAQIPLTKADAQGAGSAATYGRRYGLMAMLGVAPVDDDGEGAVQRQPANNGAPQNGLGTAKRDTGPGSVDGKDWWDADGPGVSPAAAKRDEAMTDAFENCRNALREARDLDEWKEACRTYATAVVAMPKAWRTTLRDEADTARAKLSVERTAA